MYVDSKHVFTIFGLNLNRQAVDYIKMVDNTNVNRKVLEMWKIELCLAPSGITYLFVLNCLLFPFPRIQVLSDSTQLSSSQVQ